MTSSNLTTPTTTSSNAEFDESEFKRFEDVSKALLSVTKGEIDKVHQGHSQS